MSSTQQTRRGRAARAPSRRTRVTREPQRAVYDREAIDAILDAALVAHVGTVDGDGQPFVIPTLHARAGDELLIHGSSASRTLRAAGARVPLCVTVTILDGLVLARSVFNHSVNYRSVVVIGEARAIEEPDEKLRALRTLTEQLVPGRWDEVREPTRKELKATAILSLALDEASAKVRGGPPRDGDGADGELDVWAGEIPLRLVAREPLADPELRPGIELAASARGYERPGLVAPAGS